MNKTETIEKLSVVTGFSKKDSEVFLNGFIKTVTDEMVSGGEVNITGFLKFEIKDTAERQGRNPSTGEDITIPAGKKISVKVGKTLKDSIK
jgi:DNA-binding protein HU-beta